MDQFLSELVAGFTLYHLSDSCEQRVIAAHSCLTDANLNLANGETLTNFVFVRFINQTIFMQISQRART